MKLVIAGISPARSKAKSPLCDALTSEYMTRAGRYAPCTSQMFDSEALFFAWVERQSARTSPVLILADSGGKALSSEEFASRLRSIRDGGAQTVILAIGPPDGWSAQARARAELLLSFGPMTLPHELARVVLAEQLYRALTILAGHPYHSGH